MRLNWFSELTRHEQFLLAGFLVVKIALLFILPLTGDEAYFIHWSKELSLGYYDHPPMVGWTIWGLSLISDDLYFFRFFAFLSSIVIAMLLFNLAKEVLEEKYARLISLAYLVSPISMLSVLLANDVVLAFFGFVGFYYYIKAQRTSSVSTALLAGLLLAFAFLSKYLSAMFFIGIFVYSIINYRKVDWKVALIVAAIVLLGIGENIYYNLENCWNNILFNLVSRTKESGLEIKNVGLLVVTVLVLISPVAIYHSFKAKKRVDNLAVKVSIYVCLTYLLVFALVSTSKTVGLHWFALAIPFVFISLTRIPADKLSGVFKYAAYVSLVIGVFLVAIVVFSESIFDLKRKHRDVAFYLNTAEVCEQLPEDDVIFTTGYSTNSVLAYHCPNKTFHVAFDQSKYGREDDKRVSFADYSGKDVWVFDKDDDVVDAIAGYFTQTETRSVALQNGTTFILVKGSSFNFEKYRSEVLKPVCEQYYNVPDWLPKGKCRFKEKYGF